MSDGPHRRPIEPSRRPSELRNFVRMRGHTLVELTFVLLLMAVVVGPVAPMARKARDRAAVVAAREAVVALFAEARQGAIESGAGSVLIDADRGIALASVRGVAQRTVFLVSDFSVTLDLSGARPVVELRYDALGLGRVAAQTVVFRRGGATAVLVVSSYGRIRRA